MCRQASRPVSVYKQKVRWTESIGPFVVPPQGLEPWTPTLRVSCSTN